jgi:uncharacterized membrane protein
MSFLDQYQRLLQKGIVVVETIAYSVSFVIISLSMFRATMLYISDYNDLAKAYLDTRMDLGESIGTALSFILGAQIFKLFYVTSYRHLVIVISLVIVKMLVSYFLEREMHL